MGKTITLSVLGLFLILGAWHISQRVDMEMSQQAYAETDTLRTVADCTDPVASYFVPDLAYTVTWAAPARASASTPSATAALGSTEVNGDTAPTVTASLSGTDGFVILTHNYLKTKVAGIQCQLLQKFTDKAYDADGIEATAVYDVAFQADGGSTTAFATAGRVDNIASIAALKLRNSVGGINLNNPSDGAATDQDGAINGEVVAGSAVGSGLIEINTRLDFSNTNPSTATLEDIVMEATITL